MYKVLAQKDPHSLKCIVDVLKCLILIKFKYSWFTVLC